MVAALLLEADRRGELRQHVDEHAGVACDAQRLRGLGAEQELRELAEPVGRDAAADPLAGDKLDARRVGPHLCERLLVGVEAEL